MVAEQMLDQKRPVASATLAFSLPCSASSMSKARTPRTWTFIDPFAKTLRYRSKTSARISPLPLHGKPSIGNSPSAESGAYAHSPPLLLDLAGDLKQLSSGATTAASVIERIEHLLGARTD